MADAERHYCTDYELCRGCLLCEGCCRCTDLEGEEEAWQASGITVVPATVPPDDEDKWFYRQAAGE